MNIIWNENIFRHQDEKTMIHHLFFLLSIKMIYSPTHVIKENIKKMVEMVQELLSLSIDEWKASNSDLAPTQRKKLQSLSRRLNSLNKGVSMSINLDGVTAQRKVFDFLLGLEGMGSLPGFGFSDKFGNSEKVSLTSTTIENQNQVL